MPTFDRKPMGAAPRVPGGARLPADDVWDVLERFGLALAQCGAGRDLVRLTLEVVREGLEADAVYWDPDDPAGAVEQAGGTSLEDDWCRSFTARALAEAPDRRGPLLCSFLDPGAKPMAPWPCSAALMCVGRPGGAWLAALSFHPRRLFGPADLGVLRLARRMLLNQRLCALRYQSWKESLSGLFDSLDAALTGLGDGRRNPDAGLLEQFRACRRKLDALRQQGGIG